MADLPYTYTDRDGDRLIVDATCVVIVEESDGAAVSTHVLGPGGADAVALARAVLAAAGNTGHVVVHKADLIGAENAVVAMRQRAAHLTEYSDKTRAEIADEIRSLPLLPGDEARDV